MALFTFDDWAPPTALADPNDPGETIQNPYGPAGNPDPWRLYAVPYVARVGPSENLPGGKIFFAPEHSNYRESYVDGVKEVTRFFKIDYGLQTFFADILLGSATLIPNIAPPPAPVQVITRRLPKADPVFTDLFAESAEIEEVVGVHAACKNMVDVNGDPADGADTRLFFADGTLDAPGLVAQATQRRFYTRPGKVIMRVTFRKPPYRVLPDVRPAGGGVAQFTPENLRYVYWREQFAGDSVQLANQGQFRFDGLRQILPAGAAKMLPLINLKVQWYKVPFPPAAFASLYGFVNSTQLILGGFKTFVAQPQTALFVGATEMGEQKFFPNGMPYCDYELNFVHRLNPWPTTDFRPVGAPVAITAYGWNNYYKPSSGDFHGVSKQGKSRFGPGPLADPTLAGDQPYQAAEFANLFTFP